MAKELRKAAALKATLAARTGNGQVVENGEAEPLKNVVTAPASAPAVPAGNSEVSGHAAVHFGYSSARRVPRNTGSYHRIVNDWDRNLDERDQRHDQTEQRLNYLRAELLRGR